MDVVVKDVSSIVKSRGGDMEHRLHSIGEELRRNIQGVIDALPEGHAKPAQLARHLGLEKVLTSRVVNAIRHEEPLATLSAAPGPAPLRRLLAAARKKKVPEQILRPAAAAMSY